MKAWFGSIIVVTGLGLAIACSSPGAPMGETAAVTKSVPAAHDLEGTQWVLESLGGNNLVIDTSITMAFEGGRLTGFAGCNSYGGPYETPGGNSFAVMELSNTAQLCETPEGVMRQEETFLRALLNAREYQVAENRLELEGNNGEIELVFARLPEAVIDHLDLVGTGWRLLSLNGHSATGEPPTTIFFTDDTFNGNTVCRDYSGTYVASGGDIHFPFLEMMGSSEACSQTLLEQEGAYTTALEWVRNFRLEQGQLQLLTARSEVLTFTPFEEVTGRAPHEPPAMNIIVQSVDVSPGSRIVFSGESSVPDGSCLYTQLYMDGEIQDWWPADTCAQVQNGFWKIEVQLAVREAPLELSSQATFSLRVWSRDTPSIESEEFFFDLSGPTPSD